MACAIVAVVFANTYCKQYLNIFHFFSGAPGTRGTTGEVPSRGVPCDARPLSRAGCPAGRRADGSVRRERARIGKGWEGPRSQLAGFVRKSVCYLTVTGPFSSVFDNSH